MSIRLLPTVGACLALALTACGKEEKKKNDAKDAKPAIPSAPITATFLVAADAAPSARLDTLTEAKMLAELNEEGKLYANQPEKAKTQADACTEALLGASVIKVTGERLTFGMEHDARDCLKLSVETEDDVSFDEGRMKYFFDLSCKGVDLAKYDGKTFNEIEEQAKADVCTSSTELTNVEITSNYSGTIKDGTKTIAFTASARYISITSAEGLTPCTATQAAGVESSDGCSFVKRSLNVSQTIDGKAGTPEPDDYMKVTTKGLKSPDDETSVWHSGGAIEAIVNEWKGTITYTGAATAPTYVMKKGATEAKGSLTATPGLHLVEGMAPASLGAIMGRWRASVAAPTIKP